MVAFLTLRDQLGRELEEERGIPLSWYEVMLLLNNTPDGRMRITDLAHALVLSKSGLSQLVSRMQAEGLLCREAYTADRRGVFATLTDRGRRVFRRAAVIHLRGIEEHFASHLSLEDARMLQVILAKVAPVPIEEVAGDCGESAVS